MKNLVGRLNLKMICCWLLLLQMVNLSINPIRHQNYIHGVYTIREDLSVNKIESIYELISEYVFKKNVPETQDAGEQGLVKVAVFFHLAPEFVCCVTSQEQRIIHNHAYRAHFPKINLVLESPPPRATS